MLLVKKATIIDSNSKLNGKQRDLLIVDGKIKEIKANIKAEKATIINTKGLCVSIGWVDLGAQVGDPGYEHREDLTTVGQSAAAGGYTGLICQPNTDPVVHSKSEVLYIKNNTRDSLVDFFPLGAISRNCKGEDITEMLDMHQSGAVAFTDGKYAVQNNGMMMRALQYVKAFDGVVINHPHDYSIGANGIINEGTMSVLLGMKGIPKMAEEMMVLRDIHLSEYTDSNVHIFNVSTANSVGFVRDAKKRGIKVTASVAALNLVLDDTVLEGFDAHYKVLPPLREQKDIKALKDGLKDGTIDLIASNHIPLEEEAKKLEFSYAKFGAIGLETTFALANTHLRKVLNLEKLIDKLSIHPRQIFGLPIPSIQKDAPANLTLFQPEKEWTFTKNDIYSKSRNTPLLGEMFKGKVIGTINNGQFFLKE